MLRPLTRVRQTQPVSGWTLEIHPRSCEFCRDHPSERRPKGRSGLRWRPRVSRHFSGTFPTLLRFFIPIEFPLRKPSNRARTCLRYQTWLTADGPARVRRIRVPSVFSSNFSLRNRLHDPPRISATRPHACPGVNGAPHSSSVLDRDVNAVADVGERRARAGRSFPGWPHRRRRRRGIHYPAQRTRLRVRHCSINKQRGFCATDGWHRAWLCDPTNPLKEAADCRMLLVHRPGILSPPWSSVAPRGRLRVRPPRCSKR
jgi:hypothetical protein